MLSGTESRLRNIFSSTDDRSLCIACDHGLMTDPNRSWLQISDVVQASVKAQVDGLLLGAGQTRRFASEYGRGCLPGIIVRTDWVNLLRISENPTDPHLVLPVDHMEFRRLMNAQEVLYRYRGSAAIGFLFIDPDGRFEALTLQSSRELIQECHTVGLPCIIEVLALTNRQQYADPLELLSRGVRLALDLGADAIKMPMTEELQNFCSVIHQAGKRLFILGGSNLADEDLFLSLMQQAMEKGVDGLLVGRNVSKSLDPGRLI